MTTTELRLTWRRGRGWYADPGFVRSAWFPWLFTTMQGVAYSAPRVNTNVFMLIFGWGMFIYAGMVALYSLGNALWDIDDDGAAPCTSGTAPEIPRPQAASASAPVERTDRPAAGGRRTGHGAGPALRPADTGNPCYKAWLDQSLRELNQAATDQEQSAWADALAQEVRATYPGVHVSLRMDRGYLLLFLIVLPKQLQGSGLGTRVMEHLTSAADMRGVGMTLNPSGNFGADPDRLHDFYRRLGFVTNKWRGEIGAASEVMVRVPRNSAAAVESPVCFDSCCEEGTS
ncbi:GNAT family N-acetyltransferase (plasmid) [Streptomyces sp. NBC_01166]|uniref:GNAT family N-acetyltransferase n=1 Tax=Streptomyces sp. NBC_01166 TaxID=2903755 RepID=UPI002F90FC26|nr:GNAT family N-acetyltransferase [Streptomyces sp. NBC_01166]